MSFKFSNRSLDNLKGVHPALVKVVTRALEISPVDFMITEGLRSKERQKKLFASGATRTMNSRHITGHAIDVAAVVNGEINWSWALYEKIAEAIKAAAKELRVPIIWGGNWKTFKDGPHFELDRKFYP